MSKKLTIAGIVENEKNLTILKALLLSYDLTFEEWYKYAKKIDYPALLGIDNEIRIFVNNYLEWVLEYRGFVITLDFILESLDQLYIEKTIDKTYVKNIKEKLQKMNYNSMKVDWR